MGKKARYDHYAPGEIIKQRLKEKGMQQNELAEIVNMSPATVNDIVSGKRGMTGSSATKDYPERLVTFTDVRHFTQKRKTMKTIKATFIIQEDSHNAEVIFYDDKGKKILWENLSSRGQVRMLNAWAGMYQLFYRFLKEEDDDNERIQDQ